MGRRRVEKVIIVHAIVGVHGNDYRQRMVITSTEESGSPPGAIGWPHRVYGLLVMKKRGIPEVEITPGCMLTIYQDRHTGQKWRIKK